MKARRLVFTDYVWAFEITSALLGIAVVAAVLLSRRPQAPRRDDTGCAGAALAQPSDASPDDARRRRPPSLPAAGGRVVRDRAGGPDGAQAPLIMLMCVELMLNAVNLTLVSFSQTLNDRVDRWWCSS
nr:hypothetical protein [Candidatus Microthrix sp.]